MEKLDDPQNWRAYVTVRGQLVTVTFRRIIGDKVWCYYCGKRQGRQRFIDIEKVEGKTRSFSPRMRVYQEEEFSLLFMLHEGRSCCQGCEKDYLSDQEQSLTSKAPVPMIESLMNRAMVTPL